MLPRRHSYCSPHEAVFKIFKAVAITATEHNKNINNSNIGYNNSNINNEDDSNNRILPVKKWMLKRNMQIRPGFIMYNFLVNCSKVTFLGVL